MIFILFIFAFVERHPRPGHLTAAESRELDAGSIDAVGEWRC